MRRLALERYLKMETAGEKHAAKAKSSPLQPIAEPDKVAVSQGLPEKGPLPLARVAHVRRRERLQFFRLGRKILVLQP